MSKNVKIIFGAATLGGFDKDAKQEVMDILTKNNVKDLDTAYIYVKPTPSPVNLQSSYGSWLMWNRMEVKKPWEH